MRAFNKLSLILIFFIVMIAGIGVASAGNEYYVAIGGSNNNTGLSISEAWATPSYAAQQAQAGDTIYLAGGTWYGEHVVFANSGRRQGSHRCSSEYRTRFSGYPLKNAEL